MNNKIKHILIISITILLVILIIYVCLRIIKEKETFNELISSELNHSEYNIDKESNSIVCFNTECVNVEVVDSDLERKKGLMHREFLEEKHGLLFIFDTENRYSFWMKDTLIPLDIIWINKSLEIIHIEKAEPCKVDPCKPYIPKEKAIYVVEVNAGYTEKNSIQLGDRISIDL